MEIIIIGIGAIVVTILIAIYAIAKILKMERLVGVSFFSFLLIFVFFGGGAYFFLELPALKEKSAIIEEVENFPLETPFAITVEDETVFFETFNEAVERAKLDEKAVFFRNQDQVVWKKTNSVPPSILQVPLILQLPELARGEAVTSLAMLLRYAGKSVSKLELARHVKKDLTPLTIENQLIFYGHPNNGFVGDIYSLEKPGYGVYHRPIYKLAESYLPNQMIDMTGALFDDILYPLYEGRPIWVIVHTQFRELSDDSFQMWQTPLGEIEITSFYHAVLITGFDGKNIYYNDPLSTEVNRPVLKELFQVAWEQMGSQAISYIEE